MPEKVVPARPATLPEPLETVGQILSRMLDEVGVTPDPSLVRQYARAVESICRYHFHRRPREGA